jgi:phage shock protein A
VALPSLGALWRFARKVEDLFALQNANQTSLEAVAQQLHDLNTRIARLESEQARVIAEARGAATTSASMVAAAVVSDTVTRLTRLEGRVDQMERHHPPPPIG